MAAKNNINKIISNPLVQTCMVYISAAWIVLEITEYFINNYNLTDRFRNILLIIMIIGLPVAIFLTWYLSREKEKKEEKEKRLIRILLKRPWFSIPGILVILLLMFSAVRFVYNYDTSAPGRQDTDFSNISKLLHDAGAEVSLAVLPFTSMTGNSEQDWLVTGQHETLIHELSKLSQVKPLRIISRSTVNAFKNYDKTIPELAREINVDYLVEASVLGAEDSVTLQLRLIEVDPVENVVWAESCSSYFSNILKLHNDIASQIIKKMNLEMTPEDIEAIPLARQVDPECYKAYVRGLYHLNSLTPEGNKIGLEYLHEAVRIDPGEPLAYAGLALGYIEIAHGPFATDDDLIKAEAAAAQAFKLDTTMAEVYSALAELYFYKTWEFDKMEAYFIKALELNPNLARTHFHYSWALYVLGRMEEAIEEHKLAIKYDPFRPVNTAWLAGLYCYDGQYEKAIEIVYKSFEILENNSIGLYILGITYLQMERTDEAIKVHKKLAELNPRMEWALGFTYATAGNTAEAKEIAHKIEKGDIGISQAYGLINIYSGLNDMNNAFKYLAHEPPAAWLVAVTQMPEFENLRKDPRFEEFKKRQKFPE